MTIQWNYSIKSCCKLLHFPVKPAAARSCWRRCEEPGALENPAEDDLSWFWPKPFQNQDPAGIWSFAMRSGCAPASSRFLGWRTSNTRRSVPFLKALFMRRPPTAGSGRSFLHLRVRPTRTALLLTLNNSTIQDKKQQTHTKFNWRSQEQEQNNRSQREQLQGQRVEVGEAAPPRQRRQRKLQL